MDSDFDGNFLGMAVCAFVLLLVVAYIGCQ